MIDTAMIRLFKESDERNECMSKSRIERFPIADVYKIEYDYL